MEARDFTREIRQSWELLRSDLQLGKTFVCPTSLRVDPNFRDVALSSESSYEEIYRAGLSLSHYNILLTDYAYFQFSHTSETRWRLGYFPNPWISGVASARQTTAKWEALEESGNLSHEEVSTLLGDMPYLGAIPPIRFEYDPAQYRELCHPAAHFHIGRHSENRWPCAITVGPLAFTLMIAKMYYPEIWGEQSTYWGANPTGCIDQRFLRELTTVLPVSEFSANERLGLHFGKLIAASPQKPGE